MILIVQNTTTQLMPKLLDLANSYVGISYCVTLDEQVTASVYQTHRHHYLLNCHPSVRHVAALCGNGFSILACAIKTVGLWKD